MNFPRVLQHLRKEAGMTQEQVADYVGVKRLQVSRWEHGEQKPIQRQLAQLCSLFGKTVKQLMGERPLDEVEPVSDEEIRRELKAMIELLPRQALGELYGSALDRMRSAISSDRFTGRLGLFKSGAAGDVSVVEGV